MRRLLVGIRARKLTMKMNSSLTLTMTTTNKKPKKTTNKWTWENALRGADSDLASAAPDSSAGIAVRAADEETTSGLYLVAVIAVIGFTATLAATRFIEAKGSGT